MDSSQYNFLYNIYIYIYNYMTQNIDFFFNFNKKIRQKIINKYDFLNLNSLNSIKNIGGGISGDVYKLIYENKFENKNNIFEIVVKASKERSGGVPDNLFYEFYVSCCINIIKEFYPNFTYTFLFFTNNDNTKLEQELESKNKNNIKNIMKNNIDFDIESINIGCNSKNIINSCILNEFIPNGISFSTLKSNDDFNKDYDYNMFTILFQIYAVLFALKDIYTHYDLHPGNTMYVNLKKIIKIIYVIDDTEYYIYTQFIPVIIDYGRSYIKYEKFDSNDFGIKSCESNCNDEKIPNCDTSKKGIRFKKINNNWKDSKWLDINKTTSRIKNNSADMHFINDLIYLYSSKEFNLKKEYKKIFNEITSPDWWPTGSLLSNGFTPKEYIKTDPTEDTPRNIMDVLKFLIKYYNTNNFNTKNYNDTDIMKINCDISKKQKFEYIKYNQMNEINTKIFELAECSQLYNIQMKQDILIIHKDKINDISDELDRL